MQLGFVGLGKMGANMVRRLMQGGHSVTVYDRSPDVVEALRQEGAATVAVLEELPKQLPSPRVVWLMVPAGEPVDRCLADLAPLLSTGDVVVDGGNSNFRETMRRGEMLATRGVSLVDAGTSGGVWGLKNGYCMMVGGSEEAFHTIEPLLKTLAPEDGYLRVGACGAGHYVKMIHNGIEYGMMQAYAEGFDILQSSPFHLPVDKIAHLWNQGSVVRSWLLELVERMLQANPKLDGIKGYVPDSGEGRWTVEEAINLSIPAPILTMSLITRFRSRQEDLYADRFLAALRNQFGGHEVKKR